MLNSEILLETAQRLLGEDLDLRLHYVHTAPNLLQFRRAIYVYVFVWKNSASTDTTVKAIAAS